MYTAGHGAPSSWWLSCPALTALTHLVIKEMDMLPCEALPMGWLELNCQGKSAQHCRQCIPLQAPYLAGLCSLQLTSLATLVGALCPEIECFFFNFESSSLIFLNVFL